MAASYTIGEHFEAMVEGLVESGRYKTADDVVQAGLRLVEAREQEREAKLEALRAAIQEGIDSGPGEEFDSKTLAEDVKRRGRERLVLVKERDAQLEALRADIQEGFDSGPAEEVGDMFARIKAEGRQWLAKKNGK